MKDDGERMKIVMIAPTPFFADRGCHTRIYGEIRGLQAMGHRVILVTYGLGRDMPGAETVRCFNFPWYRKLSAGPSVWKIRTIGSRQKRTDSQKQQILIFPLPAKNIAVKY